ncbi:hypothetical protein CXB51_026886 [Gossypium anomalum]|uniref:Alpha N-terminal protein methyltransferase 1 n=1 Tax=Gossypium anomalum TaxID=47600 RepID=A0A8J5YIA3_9ROSI|nr:hypothetical protein CXB51_026886 [Gossypium anomalum]
MWIRPIPKAVSQQYPIITQSPPPYLRNSVKRTITKARLTAMEAAGSDSDGREFKNAQEMWKEQIGDEGDDPKKIQWYREGVAYWEGVEASVDGVLGGFGQVNDADIKGSEAFLNSLLHERFGDGGRNQHLVALEFSHRWKTLYYELMGKHGWGWCMLDEMYSLTFTVAAVNMYMLHGYLKKFSAVDLLEPVSHFLDAARENLSQEHFVASDVHKATNFYCVPLQEFTPEAGRYNVIWIQWCIGHLTDDDFISFFKRAKVGLKPGGFFILKENIARNGFVLDNEDRSITRSDLYFKDLFHQCGLHLYKMKDQKGLPEELFAVKMYALTTEVPKKVHKTRSKVQANRPGIIK